MESLSVLIFKEGRGRGRVNSKPVYMPLDQINPLTAGAEYIRVFTFYQHSKHHILNKLKIKYDINQQEMKRVDLHFVKSEDHEDQKALFQIEIITNCSVRFFCLI